jgi:hypothetical protein
MAIKRDLLESVAQENPAPEAFERWLMERCHAAGTASGPVRAMALDVYAEWRLAEASRSFQTWLDQGAPSDDAQRGDKEVHGPASTTNPMASASGHD